MARVMKPKQKSYIEKPDPLQAISWANGTIGEGLDRVENLVGRIGMNSAEQARAILSGLDVLFARIQAMDNPVAKKPLQVQMNAVLAHLRNEAGTFLRDLGGASALLALRAERQPPAENAWWYLDEWQAQRRKDQLHDFLRVLAGVALVVALLVLIYQIFLAPDPDLIARLNHEDNAREALLAGDVREAHAQIEQGLQYDANDLDLLILKGVAFEAEGKNDQAQAAFDQAVAAAENLETFFLSRAQTYFQSGNLEAAIGDVQLALEENPQSAPAYLLYGQIYETQRDYLRAFSNYEQAASLAEAQEQHELTAMARVRIAFLSQILNSPQLPTETSTP
jgi:tetratricopeptide (TPR) repeat protein